MTNQNPEEAVLRRHELYTGSKWWEVQVVDSNECCGPPCRCLLLGSIHVNIGLSQLMAAPISRELSLSKQEHPNISGINDIDRTSLNCTKSINIWQTYMIPQNICKVMCEDACRQRSIHQKYKYISPSAHNFKEMTYLRDCNCFPCFVNAGTHLSSYISSICPLMDGSILIFSSLLSDALLPPVTSFPDNKNL